MKFSIIINTHNQSNLIQKSVRSCFFSNKNKFEIIVVDTSNKINNLNFPNKKVKYFRIKQKYSQPEMNQMYKIYFGLKKSKGDFVLLLDGDDEFDKKKLIYFSNLCSRQTIIFNQDLPVLKNIYTNKRKLMKIKKYKNSNFFKKNIILWPQVYGTSSILIKSEVLRKFFNQAKPFSWPLLAIDIQLLIFCYLKYRISNIGKGLTIKKIHNNNLGAVYLNIFKKIFWKRRNMQFNYYFSLNKNKKYSLDYLLTKFINYLI